MATGRKVIFSTYVVPTQTVEAEETSITHTEFLSSPGKTLGGKGVATIHATQWGDDWTSMSHPEIDLWEEVEIKWEDVLSPAWEVFGTGGGDIAVTDTSVATLSSDSSALGFLYVKNTGSSENALVALDAATGPNYYIVIPPGGSSHLKGDNGAAGGGAVLLCNGVRVKCASSNGTTVEYIIAKAA